MAEKTQQKTENYLPRTWDEMIGQDQAKDELRIAAESARHRGVQMENTLLASDYPGIGKTSLAWLLAAELGGKVQIETEPLKPAQLRYLFMDLGPKDILFIDEIHRWVAGGKNNAEWLLYYLEEGIAPDGSTPGVTLVAATTDAGRLPTTILGRFDVVPTLTPYNDEQGARIAVQLSRRILVEELGLPVLHTEVAAGVAAAANNSPREMRRILKRLRDLVITGRVDPAGGRYDLAEALVFAGVTPDGLSRRAVEYLSVMRKEFGGGPAGRAALQQLMREPAAGIDVIERVLRDKGYLSYSASGRVLSPAGLRRARELET